MFNNIIPRENVRFDESNSLFVVFKIGKKTYAFHVSHTIEVLKLPLLEYPQKLPKHIVGILNYYSLTINVVDLRSILDLEKQDCSINSQLVVVRTQEAIFGIIVDEVLDVMQIPPDELQFPPYSSSDNIIKMLYQLDSTMISIIDLYSVENVLKDNKFNETDVNYESLFPQDEVSRKILKERSNKLITKSSNNFAPSFHNQDQFILVTLGENIYCINMKYIKELVSYKGIKITKLPFTPDYIEGVINLRGDFVTIINLKEFLNLEQSDLGLYKKILVFDSKDYKLAILVDEILTIKSIDNDKFIHKSSNKFDSKYTMAEIIEDDKIYNILNVEKILNDEKLFINIES